MNLPDAHRDALAVICARLPLATVDWALTGSAGHRLQGVDAPWGPPVDPADHRRIVRYAGFDVPVLDLSHEAEAYDLMGRHERAALLRRA